MRKFCLLLLLLIPGMANAACPETKSGHAGKICVVSASGSGSTCSEASPCSLTFATGASTIAVAGDEIWLKGGTYTLQLTTNAALAGTSGSPITIRSHCGADAICSGFGDDEWAILDSYATTTLSQAITDTGLCSADGGNDIFLTDGTLFPAGSDIQIGTERIRIVGKSSTNVINNCLRGIDSSTAATHSNGSLVENFGTSISDFSKFTIWRDFEISNSYPTRAFASGGAGDWTTKRGAGIFYFTTTTDNHNKFINIVIHDANNGIMSASNSALVTYYGIISNWNGLKNTDANGLGCYSEGTAGQAKLIKHGIFYDNASGGCKNYAETGNVDDHTVEENIALDNGAWIAQLNPRPSGWNSTSSRGTGFQLGGGGGGNQRNNTYNGNVAHSGTLNAECVFPGAFWWGYLKTSGTLQNWTLTNNYGVYCNTVVVPVSGPNLTMTGNTFIQPRTGLSGFTTIANIFIQTGDTGWSIDSNTYWDMRDTENVGDGAKRYSFAHLTNPSGRNPAGCCRNSAGGGGTGGASQLPYDTSTLVTGQSSPDDGSANSPSGSGWKQWGNGWDASSTYNGGSLPSTNKTGCFANQYETGRAHIYIINWQAQASPTVNVSCAGLSNGDSYAIWDAENWTNWLTSTAIITGTYSSGAPNVAIPMSSLANTRAPIGSGVTVAHTANAGAQGGMFVGIIRKTAAPGGAAGSRVLWIGALLLVVIGLPIFRYSFTQKPAHEILQPVQEREKVFIKRVDNKWQ